METTFDTAQYGNIPELASLEYDIFEHPWDQNDFKLCIHETQNVVLKNNKRQIVAYAFYSKDDEGGAEILNFGVAKDYQRQGLGRKLMGFLIRQNSLSHLSMSIRESNLGAQLFLREMGFKCENIIYDAYENNINEPAYFFFLKKPSLAAVN